MKIPIWAILVVIIFCAIGGYYNYTRHENDSVVVNPKQGYYDSIESLNKSQQKVIDSFSHTTAKRDTFIDKQIIYVKEKGNSAYKLHADSSLRLFLQWTRQFEDSTYRKRYIRAGSDTIS